MFQRFAYRHFLAGMDAWFRGRKQKSSSTLLYGILELSLGAAGRIGTAVSGGRASDKPSDLSIETQGFSPEVARIAHSLAFEVPLKKLPSMVSASGRASLFEARPAKRAKGRPAKPKNPERQVVVDRKTSPWRSRALKTRVEAVAEADGRVVP